MTTPGRCAAQLDADSVMTGGAIPQLVRLMEAGVTAKAGKLSSTLFEPVDAVSVPLHTNGATLSIGASTSADVSGLLIEWPQI